MWHFPYFRPASQPTGGRRRRMGSRLRGGEPLEPRRTLDGDASTWADAPYLTMSFAPDGTDIAGQPSVLQKSMQSAVAGADWQQAIRTAVQTWVIHVSGDVSTVPDGGQPFGAPGLIQGDTRFGDIRVGAVPLRGGIYALAVSRGFVAGTWTGDIIFNSRRIPSNIDSIFGIALHEAGHIFGLEDNGDPTSPMRSHGIPSVHTPNANDIAGVQARFGARGPDMHEAEEPNNLLDEATQIEAPDDYAGTYPVILFGDVGAADIDHYRFDSFQDISGPVTFTVRSRDLSLLRPRITILDEWEVELTTVESTRIDGDRISLTLPNVDVGERYYVRVEGAGDDVHNIGGYSLLVTYDDQLQTSPAALDEFSGPAFRFFEPDDLLEIFAEDDDGDVDDLNDDLATNESLSTATVLEPLDGFVENSRYQTQGSLAGGTDIDVYRLRSPDFAAATPRNLTLVYRGLSGSTADPWIEVLDASGTNLTVVPLVRDEGGQTLQVWNVSSSQTLFVRLQDPSAQGAGQSNYQLTALFGTPRESLGRFALGTIQNQPQDHPFVLNKAVLLSPAIVGGTGNTATGTLRVTLIDAAGQTVTSFSTAANRYRSAPAVFLNPGSYFFRVTVEGTLPSAGQPYAYELQTARVTDPLAIRLAETRRKIFKRYRNDSDEFVVPTVNPPGAGV